MQHKAVGVFAAQCVNNLLIARSAQRGNGKGLRFAAGKQCRAVCARQYVGLDVDGAHGAGVAPINARLPCQNLPAYHVGFQLFKDAFDFIFRQRVGFFGNQRGFNGSPCFVQFRAAGLFLADFERFGDGCARNFAHFGNQFGIGFRCLPIPHFGVHFVCQFVDGGNHGLHLLMTKHHRAQHHVFGQNIGFGFHHQHGLLCACHHQIQLRCCQFGFAGVEQILPVGIAHTRRANWPCKWHAA